MRALAEKALTLVIVPWLPLVIKKLPLVVSRNHLTAPSTPWGNKSFRPAIFWMDADEPYSLHRHSNTLHSVGKQGFEGTLWVCESTAVLVVIMLDFKRVVSDSLSEGTQLMEAALGILWFSNSSTRCSLNAKTLLRILLKIVSLSWYLSRRVLSDSGIWATRAFFAWSSSSRTTENGREGRFCSLLGSELTTAVLMRFCSSRIKTLLRTKLMFITWLDGTKSYFSRITKLWESSKSCDKTQFECDDSSINWAQTWIYGHWLHVHSFLWYNSQTYGKLQDTIFFIAPFEYLSSGRLRSSAISQLSSL